MKPVRCRVGSRHLALLTLALVNCHKEPVTAPVDDGCWGATCVEQAEAAMYYGDHAAAREPLGIVCETGDAFACYRLAELHHKGKGGPVDLEKAATLYATSCEKEHGEGCEKRADLTLEGQGGPEVELEYLQKGCELQRPLACQRAGVQLEAGRGVPRDVFAAISSYEKACKLGEVDGCTAAGVLLSDPEGPEQAKARALSSFISACVGHSGYGCLRAAIAFHNGVGTKPDIDKAKAHFTRACEWSEQDGCHVVEQLNAAEGKPVTLELTTRAQELDQSGLQAHWLSCRMDEQGLPAVTAILAEVARYKPALDGCAKEGAAIGLSWEFADGRVQDARLTGRGSKKLATCLTSAMRRARVSTTGTCEAVLLLGDPDGARKGLAAKQARAAARAKKAEAGQHHIKMSDLDEE